MKILIVEDEKAMQMILSKIMTAIQGANVIVTDDLSEARLILQTPPPTDLVLLDLTLPKSTRERTALMIPEITALCPATVIVTGHEESEVRSLPGVGSTPIAEKMAVVSKADFLTKMVAGLLGKSKSLIPEGIEKRSEELLEKLRPKTPLDATG